MEPMGSNETGIKRDLNTKACFKANRLFVWFLQGLSTRLA